VASNSACWSNSMPKLCSPLSINYDFVCFPQMLLCFKTLHVTWHSLTYSTYLLDRCGINAEEQRQVGKLHEKFRALRSGELILYVKWIQFRENDLISVFIVSVFLNVLRWMLGWCATSCYTNARVGERMNQGFAGSSRPPTPHLTYFDTSPPSTTLTNLECKENGRE
jgi:hypothetical protein